LNWLLRELRVRLGELELERSVSLGSYFAGLCPRDHADEE